MHALGVCGVEGEAMSAVIKAKRCRVCRRLFVPARALQRACQYACAITYARLGGEKRQSAATKRVRVAEIRERKTEKREYQRKSIPLSKLKSGAQREFNRWILERDFGLSCICCGRTAGESGSLTGGEYDAGHYRSIGAAPQLRFNPDNVHRQAKYCNTYKSGNAVEYRRGLLDKIGPSRVEALEDDNAPHKWEREELIEIRKHYLGLWKSLKAAREARS